MTKQQLFIQLVEKLSLEKLFFGHAVIDAEDEAMMVMMHLFSQNVDEILASGEQVVAPNFFITSNKIVNQRIETLKPMAYILGMVNFCGLDFKSDERALVPRSPIAELILSDFEPWVNMKNIQSALDLCTGSGCIGLSLAHYNKNLAVDITDISSKALALAEENITYHQLYNRVKAIKSDLFASINKSYDLIVTNPPYVSDSEYQELPEEYKQEPKLGLVSTQGGLTIPVQILLDAPKYLNDNGFLFLEVGYSDDALDEAFASINFKWIDFFNGGQGVCVFSKQKLLECKNYFIAFLESKHVV